jgi:hypothetical protein
VFLEPILNFGHIYDYRLNMDTRYYTWLRHYATSRKVACSIPDEVIVFFNWPNHFQPHFGPSVDSASNRNEHQESSWG